jgi:hypothetical protein
MIKGPTPLHVIDAPTPGTGKGLLTRACLLVSHGELPPMTPMPQDEPEMRKQLATALLAGYAAVVFDNVSEMVDSPSLALAVAEPVWRGRLLGTNQDATASIRCTWVMTGNNISMSGEIARRIVHIRLDASVPHPWRREDFRHPDLIGWAREHLGELAWAALTIIRSWQAAGSPAWSRKPLGGFESWSQVMGGIIEHAGGQNFLSNLEAAYDRVAEEEDAILRFVEAWHGRYGGGGVTLAELSLLMIGTGDVFGLSGKSERGQSTTLGIKLGRMQDRIIGDWKITRADRKWCLRRQ